MGVISLLFKDPIAFLMIIVPLLYSVIAHEIAHGWVALKFGDDTAKRAGRLSFNPIVHIDPVGMLALFFVGYGWARPVPVNYLKFDRSRAAMISVSLAGCAANIAIAIIAVVILKNAAKSITDVGTIVLVTVIRINVLLGSFNLIPIPPLDGSKVLISILPENAGRQLSRLEPYGLPILLILIFSGAAFPVIEFMQKHVFMFIRFVTGS